MTSTAAQCTVNGQLVPCSQVFSHVGWLAGFGFGILLLLIAVAILAFVFWVMMVVHAIRNPIQDKALWIIILLAFGIIGAIVYYFAVKRHVKGTPSSASAGSSTLSAS